MPTLFGSGAKKKSGSAPDLREAETTIAPAKKQVVVSIDAKALAAAGSAASYIGSIDQGTSSTRFLLVSPATGRILASAQVETQQYYPHPGWHEHDPLELWGSVRECAAALAAALPRRLAGLRLAALGITNQRETTLAWNRATGRPYHRAIVWDDLRTTEIAGEVQRRVATLDYQEQQQQSPRGSEAAPLPLSSLTCRTGLPVASYFAGTKVRWLVEHVPELRRDLRERPEEVCFGTVDAWLAYQLTGTGYAEDGLETMLHRGGRFVTDATNASRWLFMDLTSQTWDQELIDLVLGDENANLVTPEVLPAIHPSSYIYGRCSTLPSLPALLHRVPLAAILGDQQAALFGQACFEPGQAKNTYGTGMFLMMLTGDRPIPSRHGLLTTIGYQLGGGKEGAATTTTYALEGSVAHSGSTIQWLRDQLQIIEKASDSERLAKPQNDGVYFVPAFAGLFAPYWRADARACIVGMTSLHDKGHICRATLEAIAYQTKDVFDAIQKDSNVKLTSLRVDGGGTANQLLMQFQADVLNIPVTCPMVQETTALGAAFAAGLAVGVWKDLSEIKSLWAIAKTFTPKMSEKDRLENIRGWDKAVSKSLGWVGDANSSKKWGRMESAIVEADYADAYSEASELDKALVLAETRMSFKRVAFYVLSQLVLTTAAVTVGYILGERKPGMLDKEKFKLPKIPMFSNKFWR